MLANPLLAELATLVPFDFSVSARDVIGFFRNIPSLHPNVAIPALFKHTGRALAYVIPSSEAVGRFSARTTMRNNPGYQAKPGQVKPVEALHFKALEAALFNRFQEAKVIQRRPSCSAMLCLHDGCTEHTFSLLGYCEDHIADDVVAQMQADSVKQLKALNKDTADENIVVTSLDDLKKKAESAKLPTKRVTSINDYLKMSELRREVHRINTCFETTPDTIAEMEAARKLLDPLFDTLCDDEVAQLYGQFKLFDLDQDGFISLDDLMKCVSFVDSNLAKTKGFKDKCQNWFAIKTFYPNIPMVAYPVPEPPFNPGCLGCCTKRPAPLNLTELKPQHVDIMVSFQHYVIAVINFRKQTEQHGVLDNLEFPFWSLRDIIVYSAPRSLKGWVWKRGDGPLELWKKRHYDIHGNSERITLNKFLDDDLDDQNNHIMSEINLRELISVTFSVDTKTPTGYDIPKNMVAFKLLMADGKRHTLCAEKNVAVQWVATLSWYCL